MFGIFKAAKEQLRQEKLGRVVSLQKARRAQAELTVALEAIGINFIKMNPVIHNALLKEAVATSAKEAVANFTAGLKALKNSSASPEAKARGLQAYYAYRAGQFSD